MTLFKIFSRHLATTVATIEATDEAAAVASVIAAADADPSHVLREARALHAEQLETFLFWDEQGVLRVADQESQLPVSRGDLDHVFARAVRVSSLDERILSSWRSGIADGEGSEIGESGDTPEQAAVREGWEVRQVDDLGRVSASAGGMIGNRVICRLPSGALWETRLT